MAEDTKKEVLPNGEMTHVTTVYKTCLDKKHGSNPDSVCWTYTWNDKEAAECVKQNESIVTENSNLPSSSSSCFVFQGTKHVDIDKRATHPPGVSRQFREKAAAGTVAPTPTTSSESLWSHSSTGTVVLAPNIVLGEDRIKGKWNSKNCPVCTKDTICAACNLALYDVNKTERLWTLEECHETMQNAMFPSLQKKDRINAIFARDGWKLLCVQKGIKTRNQLEGLEKKDESVLSVLSDRSGVPERAAGVDVTLTEPKHSIPKSITHHHFSNYDYDSLFPKIHLVASLRPFADDKDKPYDFVEIEYRQSNVRSEEYFRVTGGHIRHLKPLKSEKSYNSFIIKSTQKETFFQNFNYFLNELEGDVWWNGFLINCLNDPSERIPIVNFDINNCLLIFSTKKLSKFKVSFDVSRVIIQAETLHGTKQEFQVHSCTSATDIKQVTVSDVSAPEYIISVQLPFQS